MPELPEVETVVRALNRTAKGKVITNFEILYPKLLKSPTDVNSYKKALINKKIDIVTRKGKYIIFHVEDNILISHLRMEGKWFFEEKKDHVRDKHLEAIIELDGKYELQYYDTRKFGTFNLSDDEHYLKENPLGKLAKDAIDNSYSGEELYNKIHKKNKFIKTALLDQTIIGGIGNIYADEILFDSKIHPESLTSHLSTSDCNHILASSKKILGNSIEHGGTTIDSYSPEKGKQGDFQRYLMVHTRKNMKCKTCNSIIEKTKVNGRGTYFCPLCQLKL